LTLLDALIRFDLEPEPPPPPPEEEEEEGDEDDEDDSSWTLALYATAAPPMTMRISTIDAAPAASMTRLRCCRCLSTRRRSVSGPKSEKAVDMVDGFFPHFHFLVSLPLPPYLGKGREDGERAAE